MFTPNIQEKMCKSQSNMDDVKWQNYFKHWFVFDTLLSDYLKVCKLDNVFVEKCHI